MKKKGNTNKTMRAVGEVKLFFFVFSFVGFLAHYSFDVLQAVKHVIHFHFYPLSGNKRPSHP